MKTIAIKSGTTRRDIHYVDHILPWKGASSQLIFPFPTALCGTACPSVLPPLSPLSSAPLPARPTSLVWSTTVGAELLPSSRARTSSLPGTPSPPLAPSSPLELSCRRAAAASMARAARSSRRRWPTSLAEPRALRPTSAWFPHTTSVLRPALDTSTGPVTARARTAVTRTAPPRSITRTTLLLGWRARRTMRTWPSRFATEPEGAPSPASRET